MVEDEKKSKFCKLRILTRSLAGNLVYLLTITSPYNEQQPTVVWLYSTLEFNKFYLVDF